MEEMNVVKTNFIHYIDQIIQNKKISHSYLIEISNYDEDMKYVFDFIKMILCGLQYDELSSSNNPIINQIDHGNYPDIDIIEPDGSTIRKSQMIDLQKEYSNKSLLNNYRFYIIKNAEKLNAASANTMLKFLEEPEDNIIAILLTNNRYSVLDTILSRCQILCLKEDDIISKEGVNLLEFIPFLLDPNQLFLHYNHLTNDVIVDKNVAKEHFIEVERVLNSYLDSKYSKDIKIDKEISTLLKDVSVDRIVQILSILEEELPKLDMNVNYKLWLDCLFSRLVMGG